MTALIARRELRSLLLGPMGWTVLAVLQLLLGYAFLVQVESYLTVQGRLAAIPGAPGVTEAVVAPFVGNAAFVLLTVVPLLTMRLISEERRASTLPLLLSSPVTPRQIVLGKYFGLMSFLLLVLVMLAVMPLSLAMGGALDAGLMAASFLGLFLLVAAFAAIGLYMSAWFPQPMVAAISSFGALLLLWILDWQSADPESAGQSVLASVSLLGHYRPWLSGAVSSADVAYFVLVCALFLALATRRVAGLGRRTASPGRMARLRYMLRETMPVLALIGLFAAGVYGAERFAVQSDWTAAGRNTLSPETAALLDKVSGELKVTAFVAADSPLRRPVADLIERYRQHKPDIALEFRVPAENPQQAREAGVAQEGELVLEYLGQRRVIAGPSERVLSNGIYALLRSQERWLVFVTGHGERDPAGKANHDLGLFAQQAEAKGFRLHRLNLAVSATVPDNTAALVIAGPQVDFLPGEVALVEDYLQRGGNLLWLLDPGALRGLEPVAASLGVALVDGTVLDPTTARVNLDNPAVSLAAGYGNHPLLKDFSLITVYPHTAALDSLMVNEWVPTPLVLTAANTWVETGVLQGDVGYDQDRERRGPLTIAMALQRATHNGQAPAVAVATSQRAVIFGDGDFLSNAVLGNGGNLELGLRVLNWLAGDDELLQLTPDVVRDATLTLSSTQLAVIGFGFMLGLPLLLVAIGIAIGWRRSRR